MLILLSTQSVDRPVQEDCSSYEAIVYSDGFKQQSNETQNHFNQALKACKDKRDTHEKDHWIDIIGYTQLALDSIT